MLYSLVKPFLFALDPEKAHSLTFFLLHILERSKFLGLITSQPKERAQIIMGLSFPNPVGVAAGLDKNGIYLDVLAALGFGFIEIGTVTPRPQPGNAKPRIFRLPEEQALINRMGFNNVGVEQVGENIKRSHFRGVLGINIGKNRDTPIEKAVVDYRHCFQKLYSSASYLTINISSPNTPDLRKLQQEEQLDYLLQTIKQEQASLADKHGTYTPFVVKIAPDLSDEEIKKIAELFTKHKVDGVIAANTTTARKGIEHLSKSREAGGLSGKPLADRSTQVVKLLRGELDGSMPIIASGGIMSGKDAVEKRQAGASLVQIYTGLIYRGPGLIKEIVKQLSK